MFTGIGAWTDDHSGGNLLYCIPQNILMPKARSRTASAIFLCADDIADLGHAQSMLSQCPNLASLLRNEAWNSISSWLFSLSVLSPYQVAPDAALWIKLRSDVRDEIFKVWVCPFLDTSSVLTLMAICFIILIFVNWSLLTFRLTHGNHVHHYLSPAQPPLLAKASSMSRCCLDPNSQIR